MSEMEIAIVLSLSCFWGMQNPHAAALSENYVVISFGIGNPARRELGSPWAKSKHFPLQDTIATSHTA
jgi:hypothetical protein